MTEGVREGEETVEEMGMGGREAIKALLIEILILIVVKV